jgi:hypothetical protein
MDQADVIETVADEVDRHISTLARMETDPNAGATIRALGLEEAMKRAIAALHASLQDLRTIAAGLK